MNTTAAENNNKLFLFKSIDANEQELTKINIFKLTANKSEVLLFENYEDVFSVTIALILYLLSLNAFHFNSNNVSEFLKYYNNLCNNFHFSNKKKIYYLFKYCKSQINLYIKIISE